MSVYILTVACAIAFFIVFKDEADKIKSFKSFKAHVGKNYRVVKTSGGWLLYTCGMGLVLIALAVYGFMHPSTVSTASADISLFVMVAVIIGYFIFIYVERPFQDLHLTKDSFYHDGKTYRLSSVKSFEKKMFGYNVLMYTGQILNVSAEKARAIQQELTQLKKSK